MHVTARALWAPKAGNRSEEYEDAFWPQRAVNRVVNRSGIRSGGRLRVAVADGATETSFAGLWARRLVRAFGSGCLSGEGWMEGLQREQAAWYAEVLQKPLPWYAEEKVRSGAYAALLGLELSASGTWSSLAVGDCCLLQWREGDLVAALPAQDSTYFTSRPFLLSSNSARNEGLADQAQWAEGAWQPGDWFALMSDALAHWAWRGLETGTPPWGVLEKLSGAAPHGPFTHWIDELRTSGELRNDDVTVLLVSLE